MINIDLSQLLSPKACLGLSVLGTVILLAAAGFILQRLTALEDVVQIETQAELHATKAKASAVEAATNQVLPEVLKQLRQLQLIVQEHIQHHPSPPATNVLSDDEELEIAEKVAKRLAGTDDAEVGVGVGGAADNIVPEEPEAKIVELNDDHTS